MIGIPTDQWSGDDSSTFTYIIREYDTKSKQLVVDYDDNTHARISLYEPLPGSREDLERYIRQFTDPVERELAINDETDMSFITDMVGQQYVTGRRWMLPPPKPAPEPVTSEENAMVDDIIGDEIGQENRVAVKNAAQMFKVQDILSKQAYLSIADVFEALTKESQASVLSAKRHYLSQLIECQKATDEGKVFMSIDVAMDVKFSVTK